MSHRIFKILILLLLLGWLTVPYSDYAQPPSKNSAKKVVETTTNGNTTESVPPPSESKSPVPWMEYGEKIGLAILTLLLAFLLIKYASRLIILVSEKTHLFKFTTRRLVLISKIVLWTLVIYMVIVQILSPPVETVIVILAAAGLAIGLALQDSLKNAVNGINVLINRPFKIGDQIRIGPAYGRVQSISLQRIQILTPEETVVTIPCTELIRYPMIQYDTDATHSAVMVEIFLPPETDMVEVKKIARRAAEVSRYIYLPKPLRIFFSNELQQGRLLLKLHLQAYILDIQYERLFRSEITEVIIQELLRRDLLKTESRQ